MTKIQVIDVLEPPAIGKPEMCQGIRTRSEAETWGAAHGYPTVYWFSKRERVYADKTTRIDLAALELKKKSTKLVEMSERGAGLGDYLLLLAFLVIVFICMAGRPW